MKKDWMIKESELDDDQIKVLMATLDKSCIVSGCAGSGKSVLALIKAQRIQRELGDDYQIIVYTKALSRYMNAGRIELGLSRRFTYHYDWDKKRGKPKSKYIIVDEIQDFTEGEIRDFIGATTSNFFFFGDTAQSIYDGMRLKEGGVKRTLPVDDIRLQIPEARSAKEFSLYRNYRLPKPVARVVQVVGVDLAAYDETTYKSTETAVPRFIAYDNEDRQVEAIHRIIQKNGMTDVAILLPHNDDVKRIYEKLTRLGGDYEVKYRDNDDYHNSQESLNFQTTNPKVMTYHSAKGLQFETVFLPLVEKFSPKNLESERKALYVAMTRTYRYLYLMYSGKLLKPLSEIKPELYKTSESDASEVEDI